jgi:hypothetical protein
MIKNNYLKFFFYILALTSTQVRATLKEDIVKAAWEEKYDMKYYLPDEDDPEAFDIFVKNLRTQSMNHARVANHGLPLLLNIYETQKDLEKILENILNL